MAVLVELAGLYLDEVAAEIAAARPVLVNRDPEPGETGVPLATGIILELVDPGPDGVDRATTRVWVDGILAFDGGASPEHQPGFDGPWAGAQQTADTLRMVLHPTAPLPSDSQVQVRVASATVGGAGTLDETFAFHTEDLTAPALQAAGAIAPREVVLSFNEPVIAPNPATLVFEPQDFPAAPVKAVSAEAQGSALTVQLDTELTPGATYRVTAAGVTDLAGNPVQAPADTATFKGVRPPTPPDRSFDLWSMLPKHNRREDATGDLRRFIACLQEVTDLLLSDVDRFSDLFDLERAPAPFLDLILDDLGNPFPFDLDDLGKRKLAASLVRMYRQKGTAAGIVNAVRFFLAIEVTVDAYHLGTLVLGESELDVDWVLGPSDRRSLYTFDLVTTRTLVSKERNMIRQIAGWMKPAHTHLGNLREPTDPAPIDHWEIGLSELAETTILH
jgi:phage tail-like protein